MPEHAELFAAAQAARGTAYAPYSHITVGAALVTDDGRRFSGANVENASYGLSICAERVAVQSAVVAGARGIAAIAVAGPEGLAIAPCGACRQVLAEFGSAAMRIVYGAPGGPVETTLEALLPAAFRLGAD